MDIPDLLYILGEIQQGQPLFTNINLRIILKSGLF